MTASASGGVRHGTRLSVVIPTYQRRDIVVRTVAALERQRHVRFEVIVVVDGSTDGTAAALRDLRVSFPLKVIEQANGGRAAALNAGVAMTTGETLLFLDDDMEADPSLLEEHERAQREGADLVLGDLPLHPDSPRNLLSWGVGPWAPARRERLAGAAGQLPLGDLLTGQMSIARETFRRLGGFDTSFTRYGMFGGEDIDFGYRALKDGCRIVFDAAAVSYQHYDVDPADYLRRAYEAGRARQELRVKHPEQSSQLGRGPFFHTRRSRWLLGPFVVLPHPLSWPLRAAVVACARSGRTGRRVRQWFFALRTMEHLRGARSAQTHTIERARRGLGV